MYSIIDIETTGLKPGRDKIIEIAIFNSDGNTITDSFQTLIHPEHEIPYYITRLTGIDDAMVAHAPRFYEVAKRVVEMTSNRIFVAHNARFDYGFIKSEFGSLGYEYKRQQICTVHLSRKLIPMQGSYSLGKLTRSLNIQIERAHRAAGDAKATAELFHHLVSLHTTSLYPEKLF